MHRLLKRQLKKIGYSGGNISKEQFEKFLQMVQRAYEDDDEDRNFLEHTLEVNSQEMQDLYVELESKSKSKLAQSEARFRALAKHDSLTGIANRLSLEEELKRLIVSSKRNKSTFALLFLDLDHFKNINDTYGHDFGDKLLKEVVDRVSPELRKKDIFARLGGDEFVIVLRDINEAHLSTIIEKIIALFRQNWTIDEHVINVSTSIGVVLYPKDGENEIDLLKHADIAMYRAKELGRDKFSFFTEALNKQVLQEIELEEDMHRALQRGEFELYYQPKLMISTGEIIGSEALIRWNHPTKGILNPKLFIPLAEENGMILKIGKWVVEEALRALERFNEIDKDQKLHISVNVSPKQLQITGFVEELQRALKGRNANQLVVEVTETIMAEDLDLTFSVLQKIRELGCQISMDDFGTGYSSLAYLDKLPIDTIKIDKMFVDQIPQDKTSKKILLNTIIAMAETLEKGIIAEGVEKQYQLDYLAKKGCDFYQGFIFSRAVPQEEYYALLQKHL
jgi:diguanylate cyclase (GGDEF)-like protein